MEKIMFTVGIEVAGSLTKQKLERIKETVVASLEAVALPAEDLKKSKHGQEYYSSWHIHNPVEDACKVCRKIATVDVVVED